MEEKETLWHKIKNRSHDPAFLLGVYVLVTVLASVGEIAKGDHVFEGKQVYTYYNNYLIFKQAFFHLIENQDLYVLYLEEHWDLYKYSPSFALFMGLLAYLPDFLGLTAWNLLNSLTLFFAFRQLPVNNERVRNAMLWFVLLEMFTSIQNAQSNALIAGLVIFAFNFFEKRNVILASLCIVMTVYIKLFGLVAFALFLVYPRKLAFIAYSIGWTLVFALLPLIVVSPGQLQFLYQSWYGVLAADHAASLGLSVMGWLESWFHLRIPKGLIVLVGALLFCLPLVRRNAYHDLRFRLLLLASILLWVIIFNHRAESPTFVIAISGVALWYFTQPSRVENTILVCLVFVFTCLSPTDLFPRYFREQWVQPFVLKAVPCIFIWCKLVYDMLTPTFTPNPLPVLSDAKL